MEILLILFMCFTQLVAKLLPEKSKKKCWSAVTKMRKNLKLLENLLTNTLLWFQFWVTATTTKDCLAIPLEKS